MSHILSIHKTHPEPERIAKARDLLFAGELVVLPTETVYGLACNPSIPGALEKLRAAKGRDANKPIAMLVDSPETVQKAVLNWTPALSALARSYWPGPLTMVLETPDGWTGFRIPQHPVPLELARLCATPLALTSANQSGDPDPRTAQDAAQALSVSLILDAGPASENAQPSTVIKVDGSKIYCLREGALPFTEIEKKFCS
jgi:L-threonylcarbamoyladenylate synthase